VDTRLLAFTGIAAVLVLTPGPDFALVTRNGFRYGRRPALLTAFGVSGGLLAWGAVAAVGVAALLRTSGTAFTILKLVGAAYLVFLGVRALLEARGQSTQVTEGRSGPSLLGDAAAFRQGFLMNLLNPKAAAIYTTLIPQFVSASDPALQRSLLLGAILSVIALAWYALCAYLVGGLSKLLARPGPRRLIQRVTGTVLVALGLRLAFERR
jgi:threonine/homoserine/homoserine lactone efflux protein